MTLQTQQVTTPTKSNEWYTPSKYVEAARAVMGGVIDLDPASCELANQVVKAKRYYSKEEDGLSKPWYGRVWCNPPYGKTLNKSNQRHFIFKLIEEYQKGNVQEAVLLSTAKTTTEWFQHFWQYPICFTGYNIGFWLPQPNRRGRNSDCHIHGSIFVYFGRNKQKFIDIFSEFGAVVPANTAVQRYRQTPSSLWEVSA